VAAQILSLELLYSVLHNCGTALRSSERFILAIKQDLCESLLQNFVSSMTEVLSLSLKVFVALVAHFKDQLLAEIDVFVKSVFFRILESPNSLYEHKVLVLEVFAKLCRDARWVVEMFLNYDCVPHTEALFEPTVVLMSKLAQRRHSLERSAGSADARLRFTALKCTCTIMNSLEAIADAARQSHASPQATVGAGRTDGSLSGDGAGAGAGAGAGMRTGAGRAPGGGGGSGAGPEAAAAAAAVAAEGDADAGDASLGRTPSSSNVLATPDASVALSTDGGSSEKGATPLTLAAQHDIKKREMEMLEKAAVKFAMKPRKGIAFLQKVGRCGKTPKEVAECLYELRDVLDKTAMGDYLGGEKEINKDIMHAYIDLMDYTGLRIEAAIRMLLAGFRLPGEAQKIDRIMEKLAERYCMQNPGVFNSPDGAFVLSYSIIMLQTDLHNPNIAPENKMTKAGFISNNRGIDNGQDIDRNLLEQIYDELKKYVHAYGHAEVGVGVGVDSCCSRFVCLYPCLVHSCFHWVVCCSRISLCPALLFVVLVLLCCLATPSP